MSECLHARMPADRSAVRPTQRPSTPRRRTMPVTPITSAASSPVQYTPPAGNAQSAAAYAAEEATETAAVTRREAAHGDQVAIRKLAKQDLAKQTAPAAP